MVAGEGVEMKIELVRPPLPCPFCGGAAVVSFGKVRCMNPACAVQPKSRAWWDTEHYQQAVDEWNRRANDTVSRDL